ncbi:MAG: T9SS type A sorting domain-containing protein [Ignavibacteriae bacterium]|nr:T9SS type A sorting domain-containing protein [Ignavibacteriota bacterium]
MSTWTAGYSTSGIVGPFTPFDPQMGTTITAGASGDITIRFGATICPMKNIPTGLYTSTLYLTWKYSGSESSTMNEQIPLCISAEIIGKKCCVERPANMVAWWTLDETSGSVSDDVMGFPNDGTRINAPTVVAGKVVSALNFNGTTQYVEIPSHSEINLDSLDFTIDAWIKSVDSIGVSTMVDKRVSSPVQGFSFFLNNGKLALQLADATGTSDFCSFNSGDNCTNYSSQLSVADGQWHHIAVTVDRNDAQGIVFYKDGVASSTLYDPTYRDGSLSSNAVLHLGARSFDNSASYQGILDEVEIFKRALSATEILSIFLADSAGKCKPNNTLDDNIDVPIDRRWNLLSVPVIPPDYSATTLYPGASSMAFTYENGYNVASTLDNCSGFWLKFPEADTQKMIGRQLLTNYCRLESGWNIIGSLSGPVDVSTSEAIANLTTPTGIIISSVFGYSSGYNLVASIEPGKGYWVNASQSGTLNLESSFGYQKAGATITAGAYLSQLNKLTIKDASGSSQSLYFEKSKDENNSSSIFMLPPVPPEGVFDARFTSQRMVETYLNETGERKNLVISLHSVVYPLEVKIDVQKTLQERIVVGEIVNGLVVKTYILKNQQPILIQNSSVSALVLKVESTKPLPKEYALYQCYPNPFNPSTTISFDVPMNALVSLNVFDIIGREVATLVENQQYEVGNYELVFNAGNLASGMYFYRITAIGSDGKMFNEVKRMLLIK